MLSEDAMATSVLIPIAEYLKTSYRPDREYVDGEILERKMGKWEHARIQALLTIWLGQHERAWGIQTATEWRTQVSQTRVRIPDLVLVRRGSQPDVLVNAPLLVVEILSPDDSYSDTQRRANDYTMMGVETIWIIDPETRTGRVCSGRTWTEATRLEVAGTPIYVELETLFGSLEQAGE
jgi:Uma2 family endonuclease